MYKRQAHRCAIAPSEFWRLTPWLLNELLDAEGDAQRADYDRALFTAWHVEAFARTKRLPDLKKLLDRRPAVASRAAVAEQIRAGMSMFRRSQA